MNTQEFPRTADHLYSQLFLSDSSPYKNILNTIFGKTDNYEVNARILTPHELERLSLKEFCIYLAFMEVYNINLGRISVRNKKKPVANLLIGIAQTFNDDVYEYTFTRDSHSTKTINDLISRVCITRSTFSIEIKYDKFGRKDYNKAITIKKINN